MKLKIIRRALANFFPRVSLMLVVALFSLFAKPQRIFSQENGECLNCHSDKSLMGTRNGSKISVYVNEHRFANSIHASLTCVSCHADLEGKELPHERGSNRYYAAPAIPSRKNNTRNRFMVRLLPGEIRLPRDATIAMEHMTFCPQRI
jgi:hypothetical protein